MSQLFLFIVVFTLTGVLGLEKCHLPQQEIDFNMLPGKWHLLNINSIIQKQVQCVTLRNFLQVNEDVYLTWQEIQYNETNGKLHHGYIPMHMMQQSANEYKYDTNFEYLIIDESRNIFKTKSKVLKTQALKDAKEIFRGTYTFITDYENYVIQFTCLQDGRKFMWIHSRKPKPSVDEILKINNKLVEIGNGWDKIQWHYSGCAEINSLERLLPY